MIPAEDIGQETLEKASDLLNECNEMENEPSSGENQSLQAVAAVGDVDAAVKDDCAIRAGEIVQENSAVLKDVELERSKAGQECTENEITGMTNGVLDEPSTIASVSGDNNDAPCTKASVLSRDTTGEGEQSVSEAHPNPASTSAAAGVADVPRTSDHLFTPEVLTPVIREILKNVDLKEFKLKMLYPAVATELKVPVENLVGNKALIKKIAGELVAAAEDAGAIASAATTVAPTSELPKKRPRGPDIKGQENEDGTEEPSGRASVKRTRKATEPVRTRVPTRKVQPMRPKRGSRAAKTEDVSSSEDDGDESGEELDKKRETSRTSRGQKPKKLTADTSDEEVAPKRRARKSAAAGGGKAKRNNTDDDEVSRLAQMIRQLHFPPTIYRGLTQLQPQKKAEALKERIGQRCSKLGITSEERLPTASEIASYVKKRESDLELEGLEQDNILSASRGERPKRRAASSRTRPTTKRRKQSDESSGEDVITSSSNDSAENDADTPSRLSNEEERQSTKESSDVDDAAESVKEASAEPTTADNVGEAMMSATVE